MAKRRKRAGAKHRTRSNPARTHHKRRRGGHRYRSNPMRGLFSMRGIAGQAKDGLIVLGGQWLTARAAEQVSMRVLPDSFKTSSPLAASAAANLVGAIVTAVVARQVLPRQAATISIGGWSQAWANTIAQTDAGYKLLIGGSASKTPSGAAQIAGYAGGARARIAGYAADRRRLSGYAQNMDTAGMASAGTGMGF